MTFGRVISTSGVAFVVGACLIGVWLHEMPAELVTRAATFTSCEEEICANAGGAFPYIVCLICSVKHAAYILPAANLRELVVLEKLTGHQLNRDIPRIDLNSMVFYRVYKRSPLVLFLNQKNTIKTFPFCFFGIHFSIYPSIPRSSKGLLCFRFAQHNPECISRFPLVYRMPRHPPSHPRVSGGPELLLSTLISDALPIRAEVSHRDKTKGSIMALSVLIFISRGSRWQE